ncbi:hypothetical protein [Paenibacillus jiagnxiensis]|uniref:hypothetical protein n=1 Tax=Paenibacillus jiagnxiensis TaxID=3228926 RepID=UPI0033B018C5
MMREEFKTVVPSDLSTGVNGLPFVRDESLTTDRGEGHAAKPGSKVKMAAFALMLVVPAALTGCGTNDDCDDPDYYNPNACDYNSSGGSYYGGSYYGGSKKSGSSYKSGSSHSGFGSGGSSSGFFSGG